MFEFVENDTLPIFYGKLLEDDGVTPIDITGYDITLHIGYRPTPLIKDATVDDGTTGEFSFVWLDGDLKAGTWSCEIQMISPDGKKTVQKSIDGIPLKFLISRELA